MAFSDITQILICLSWCDFFKCPVINMNGWSSCEVANRTKPYHVVPRREICSLLIKESYRKETSKPILHSWMYEEKDNWCRERKTANQLTVIVLFCRCELAEQKWITIAKISSEVLNTNYSKVGMEVFKKLQNLDVRFRISKNISPSKIFVVHRQVILPVGIENVFFLNDDLESSAAPKHPI